MKKSRKLSSKTIRKGVSQMITLVDDGTIMGWIHIDFTNDGQLCIHNKSDKNSDWELIHNAKKIKIRMTPSDKPVVAEV